MAAPRGPAGTWVQVFGDDFPGGQLDIAKWNVFDGKPMNGVVTRPDNVSVVDGVLRLRLARPAGGGELTGAMIATSTIDGTGRRGFELLPGMAAEARVFFTGSAGRVNNWPAWWAVADPWACGGEHDIAEGLGGNLCVNYHRGCWPDNEKRFGRAIPGRWPGGWHTYTLLRGREQADVFWDGQRVASYPTDDDGDGEALVLNLGRDSSRAPVTGWTAGMKVAYVRAWRPA